MMSKCAGQDRLDHYWGGYLLGLFGSKGKARMGGNLGDSIHYIRLDSRNIIKTRK